MMPGYFIAGMNPEALLPIAIIALILFGGKKVPELAKGLGEGMKEFKKAVNDHDDVPAPTPVATAAAPDTAESAEKRPV